MSDDLVKRLRKNVMCGDAVIEEAADRIEKLEEEVGRLVKSRNKWGKLYNQTLEKLRLSVMSDSEYVKIIDEKCAEQAIRIEKLEAALREIAFARPECCAISDAMQYIARTALAGEKKDD